MTHHLDLAATYEAAREIGPWLADALAALEAPQADSAGEIELALHELAINIVDHAYTDANRATSTYRIELTRRGHELLAHFTDEGTAFVDDRPAESDEPTIGGYGLMIIEQLASSITYERAEQQNRWTVVFGAL